MSEIRGLISLLGEENTEKLKKGIIQLILEEVERELKNYGEYLLYPPDMKNIIKDAMENTDKKVSKMYKDAVIEINQTYIDKMKDYMTHQVNETELRTKIFDYATVLKYRGNEYSKEYQISEDLFKILNDTENKRGN